MSLLVISSRVPCTQLGPEIGIMIELISGHFYLLLFSLYMGFFNHPYTCMPLSHTVLDIIHGEVKPFPLFLSLFSFSSSLTAYKISTI